MRIQGMFPVPFAFDRHADPQRLNASLRRLFLAREAEGARYANPMPFTVRNAALFESRFDLFAWPQPEVAELREFCLSRVARLAGELNGYDEAARARLRVTADAWFHVTRRHGYFGVHNHPMASWSGVYCVAPGEHDAGDADSGALTFVHPHSGGALYLDAGVEAMRPPFGIGNVSYRLSAGQLVIFPSWLLHQVLPFNGDGERITVAFNCVVALAPAVASRP